MCFKGKLSLFTLARLILCFLPGAVGCSTEILDDMWMDGSDCILLQDVSHNELAELPKYIGLLSRLFRLNVSNNKLSLLPPEIGSMDCKDEWFSLCVALICQICLASS